MSRTNSTGALVVEDATARTRVAVNGVRWTARILGGLVAAFLLPFLIGGGESGAITAADAVALTAIVIMVIALVVGWFREGVAATMLLAGYAVLAIAQGRLVPAPPFLLFPILGLMFAFCAWTSWKAGTGQESQQRPDGS